MPKDDELQLELLTHPLEPVRAPSMDWAASWGITVSLGWFKLTHRQEACWCVSCANIDSVKGVTESWTPGRVPECKWVALDEYLQKLERLFGIANAQRWGQEQGE